MKTVNFGLGSIYDNGAMPRVAVNDQGVVVEVHEAAVGSRLWCHVGQWRNGIVDWGESQRYDSGARPAVAVNGSGTVVEVHEGGKHRLWCRVGRVSGSSVAWESGHRYDVGEKPSVALNNHGVAVEVHESHTGPKLYYRVGKVNGSGDGVDWGDSRSYDVGSLPRVALGDDGTVVEVHSSHKGPHLYYRVGTVDGGSISWGPSHRYDVGASPSVGLTGGGTVVEAHQSHETTAMYARTGTLAGPQVAWGPAVHYDHGTDPAVACAGEMAVQVHASADSYATWYSTSLVVDRANWMRDAAGLGAKPLWQITLPAAHDCGTYDLTTHRVPRRCRDLKAKLDGSITRPYSKAQSMDLEAQLNAGIRYLDLRPTVHDGGYHSYHDCIGSLVSDQLEQVRSFLSGVTAELVILNVSHFCGFGASDHEALIGMITDRLGPWLYTGMDRDPLAVTLGEYCPSKPCALVVYRDGNSDDPTPGIWRSLSVYDDYSDTSDFDKMHDDQLKKFRDHPGSPEQMFLLSWTLTLTKFSNLLKWGSLHQMSQVANLQLGSFIDEHRDVGRINLLFVDFFEDARATDLAILLNR